MNVNIVGNKTHENRTEQTEELTALIADLDIVNGVKYFLVIQGALITLINLGLVIFIISRKNIRKHHKNSIVTSLFISHSLIGILCCLLPYHHDLIINNIVDFGSTAMLASFCNLMLVTFDRFLAIRYPMIYNRITTTSIVIAIIIAWVIPITFMLVTMVYQRLTNLAFVLITSVSMVVLLVENSLIYSIVRQQCRKINKFLVTSNDTLDEENEARKKQASHHRAFFICIAMVLSYVIAWMPALVYVIFDTVLDTKIASKTFLNFIVFLALCNSITDPIIYTWSNRKLKTRIKRFVSERRTRAMTQLTLMELSSNQVNNN